MKNKKEYLDMLKKPLELEDAEEFANCELSFNFKNTTIEQRRSMSLFFFMGFMYNGKKTDTEIILNAEGCDVHIGNDGSFIEKEVD